MQRIRITKNTMPDRHWLVYVNEDGDRKHIDLSGCANNFSHATGYVSEDDLRTVGWRYEENGLLCYELFNVGHTVLFAPVKPGLFHILRYRLSGRNPDEAHRDFLSSFEAALNRGGWKTVERKEVAL